ncbi:amino acid-binding protein [Planctomycetales bacterium]|nr:amino acid-binding protein [Planctomycetales bacterium]GHS99417.1 amino acid-binding protein [Planctomycetales bacterium]GHT06180.1 amino acid-binding protein [Planctomycetales bacterium]GHV19347.1 amino acid-binding protein [Planctomycetales bacterium]
MKIHQLSLFLENKPGHLGNAVKLLAENNLNIATLSLADTEQFGILRLIMSEWERARQLLAGAGFVVKITEVVAIEVSDRPGGLNDILRVIGATGLNIEYMYAFSKRRGEAAILLLRFSDPDAALTALRDGGGIKLVTAAEMFG